MASIADHFGTWLIDLLADAARNDLIPALSSAAEPGLRSAAESAVQITAQQRYPHDHQQAGRLAVQIGQAFSEPVPPTLLATQPGVVQALRARIAGQLAGLAEPDVPATGQSAVSVRAVPVMALADSLTGNLVQEIVQRGAAGGALFPLAAQLDPGIGHGGDPPSEVAGAPGTAEDVFVDGDDDDLPAAEVASAVATADPVRDYLKQIGQVPLLNAEQEVELAKRIEAGRFAEEMLAEDSIRLEPAARLDVEWIAEDGRRAKNHLLEANLTLVASLARQYIGRGMLFLDLIQEGNLGLVRAAEKFDYTKGYRFATYARWWIRQAITQAMRDPERSVRIPVHMVEVINKLARVQRQMLQDLGRDPTPEELAAELDMTPEKVIEAQRYGREPVSRPTPLGADGDSESGGLIDEFGDLSEDSEAIQHGEAVSFTLLQEQLHSVLDMLSEREAGVVSMRFGLTDGQPKTLDEIGQVYGITRERIRQIESRTLRKLGHPSRSVVLGDYLDAEPAPERHAAPSRVRVRAEAIARGAGPAEVSPATPGGGGPAKTGQPSRPERFLVGRLPARVPQAAELSLLVRVTASAPPPDAASASLPALDVGPAGAKVTVVVQAPRELVPLGELEQVIVVPPAGDSPPVRFPFRAAGAGLQRVLVTAWLGGTFLAELSLEVSVQPSAPYLDGPEHAAPVGALRAEPGEVTLQVRFDGQQYTFQLLSSEYLFDPVVAEAVTAQPSEPVERTIATLRAMATGSAGGYSAGNARTWMERAGMGLWNDMVPNLIKEQFWQLRESVSAFSIAVGRDVLPWELLYPLAPGSDAGFLVEQFPVMRRVYGQQRSRRIATSNARYVMPTGSPANALDEIAAIRRILGPDGANAPEIGDLDVLLDLIESGQLGLLHFACHNTFAADAGGSAIGMAGGPFVPLLLKKAVTLQALAGHHPLVFINACRTAGTVPEYTQMMGWAEQFMAAGAGAFVGTLWAVRSDSATRFATAFYGALAGGSSLGQAGQAARLEAARDRSDPTWLAYSIYGDPAAASVTS